MLASSRSRLTVAIAAALALADASIVTLALPRLLTELDASVEGVAAVIGVYTIVLAVALPAAEALRRRLGGGPLAAVSLVVFASACAGCASAQSIETLLALRAMQAIGAAGVVVAAFELLSGGERATGGRQLWIAAAVGGVAAGPALGGLLTELLDWRAIFAAQVPVALAGAVVAARGRTRPPMPPPPPPATPAPRAPLRRAMAALALASAALTAVLFLLVLLLVAGWNLTPLEGALAVSVLPFAALAAGRLRGDPRTRAATGCVLLGAGTIALGFLPLASAWWTIVPQLLAGVGMGLALPALAGELVPERTPREAARLLSARHLGISAALLLLAPIVSSNLDAATERARERGIAVVLDSPLPPQDKFTLAPALLGGVRSDEPRAELERSLAGERGRFEGEALTQFDALAERADDTLVDAVAESFRAAFVLAGVLGLAAAAFVLPEPARRRALARTAAVALVLPVTYVGLSSAIGPDPVVIANPCEPRALPESGGVGGFVQEQALEQLDQIACHFGSSREELVLAFANDDDAREFEERHGVDPRSAGDILQGLIGD